MNEPDNAPISLPQRTAERLRALLAQRDALDGQIAAIVETAADALGVPAGWQVRDLAVGFQPPQGE